MSDRNQRQDSPHARPGSTDHPDDLHSDSAATRARDRAGRHRASVADDRGMSVDRERRSFNGDREHDELGSEMEDHVGFEDGDDELGPAGETNR